MKREAENEVPTVAMGGVKVVDAPPSPTKKRATVKAPFSDIGNGDQVQQEEVSPYTAEPGPVFGHIMDYMFYGDARKILLTNKAISTDAASHVTTVNITKISEMSIPAAKRFAKRASTVNICCLLEHEEEEPDTPGGYRKVRSILSSESIGLVVPFLSAFPHLTQFFVGSFYAASRNGYHLKRTYAVDTIDGPANHSALYDNLVTALCGAFRAGMFPLVKQVESFNESMACLQCNKSGPCRCKEYCKYFPMANVLALENKFVQMCISDVDRYRIVSQRKGGRDYLKKYSHILLPTTIRLHWASLSLKNVPKNNHDERAFWERLQEHGATPQDSIRHIPRESYPEIRALVSCGMDPNIPKRDLYEGLRVRDGCDGRIWSKSTIDFLNSIGLGLDEQDLIVVDDDDLAVLYLFRMLRTGSYRTIF